MKIVKEFPVSKSPKDVFDYIAVNYFENHQKFDPEIHGMINHTDGAVKKGTKGSEIRKVAGRQIMLDFEVTDFEPLKLFAFKNTSGPLYLERSYSLEAVSSGTKVTFVFDARPRNLLAKLAFPLLSKSMRKNVSKNIQSLKTLLDTPE